MRRELNGDRPGQVVAVSQQRLPVGQPTVKSFPCKIRRSAEQPSPRRVAEESTDETEDAESADRCNRCRAGDCTLQATVLSMDVATVNVAGEPRRDAERDYGAINVTLLGISL